jgi:hypothetical protein
MATKVFDITDVLKNSWEHFKKAPGLFIGLLLFSVAASILINVLFSFIPPIALSIISAAATSYIMLSFVKASLLVINGETPGWNVLKNDKNLYLKFFVTTILLSIIFMIASILFIIPLFLAMAIFYPVPYIVADKKDIGIIEAFKRSWAITTPQFVSCLIFIIVICIFAIVAMIPLGLGLLIAAPMIYISGAIIYKKLDAADLTSVETPVETPISKE